MGKNQNLYEYLYQVLVSQFLNGAFLQGQEFPSQRELCLQYNVGITTVRKVVKMLDERGYIRTAQGQPSVVTYKASKEAYATFLVKRRDELADTYRGLESLMPVLYSEGAKRCKELELQSLRTIMDGVSEHMSLQDFYRQANSFFITLLRPIKNQLILDLELDSENYLHIPYIALPGVEDPFVLNAGRLKTWLKKAISQIEEKQFDAFCEDSAQLYRTSQKRVDGYLYALSKYTVATKQTNEKINWFRIKGRSELYAQLAMMIIRRITAGEFDKDKYLPSIPNLMEEYGVVKNTASRAIALLNSLGFVQTIDKKGTVIATDRGVAAKININLVEPVIQERLSLFEDALQIMALTARNCAISFSPVPESLVLSLENRLRTAPVHRISPLIFQPLMNCFIQLLPYHSLKNIFQQLEELILWGYYLQAADKSLYPDTSHMAAAVNAVIEALKDPSHTELPDAFGNVFSLIYQDVHAVISQMPRLKQGSVISSE